MPLRERTGQVNVLATAFLAILRRGLESGCQPAKAITMQRRYALTAVIAPALILASCASASKNYPSLAIRDAERVTGAFVITPPPGTSAPAPLNTAMAGQIDGVVARAQSNHRVFMETEPAARRIILSGADAAVTSNAWAKSQIALGDLDSLRSVTAVALGDLDLMYADATLAFEERDKIVAARQQVIDIVREQDRILAQLRGKVSQ